MGGGAVGTGIEAHGADSWDEIEVADISIAGSCIGTVDEEVEVVETEEGGELVIEAIANWT